MLPKSISIFLCVLTLSACVTSAPPPDTFYYILEPAPLSAHEASKVNGKQAQHKMAVLPINLPHYMNQPNLVLKLDDHQIKITNYHFWGDDLRQSTQRIVINELNQRVSNTNFSKRCNACSKLEITFDHFYPSESGDVFLSGTYEITSPNGEQVQYSFSFTRSLDNGGYNEAVAKMRLLLNDLAHHISMLV